MKNLRWGLALHNHKLAYGFNCGWGHKWLPNWASHLVVSVWNPLACRIWGHDWFPDFDTIKGPWNPREDDWPGTTHDVCTACCMRREVERDAYQRAG